METSQVFISSGQSFKGFLFIIYFYLSDLSYLLDIGLSAEEFILGHKNMR